jgi:hypothetical protein
MRVGAAVVPAGVVHDGAAGGGPGGPRPGVGQIAFQRGGKARRKGVAPALGQVPDVQSSSVRVEWLPQVTRVTDPWAREPSRAGGFYRSINDSAWALSKRDPVRLLADSQLAQDGSKLRRRVIAATVKRAITRPVAAGRHCP